MALYMSHFPLFFPYHDYCDTTPTTMMMITVVRITTNSFFLHYNKMPAAFVLFIFALTHSASDV
jgi:hypothetical protein